MFIGMVPSSHFVFFQRCVSETIRDIRFFKIYRRSTGILMKIWPFRDLSEAQSPKQPKCRKISMPPPPSWLVSSRWGVTFQKWRFGADAFPYEKLVNLWGEKLVTFIFEGCNSKLKALWPWQFRWIMFFFWAPLFVCESCFRCYLRFIKKVSEFLTRRRISRSTRRDALRTSSLRPHTENLWLGCRIGSLRKKSTCNPKNAACADDFPGGVIFEGSSR